MRQPLAATAAIAATLLSGCGGGHTVTVIRTLPAALTAPACPAATSGHGSMGICAPPSVGLGSNPSAAFNGPVTYPDLSNNNPVSDAQMARIARAHPAIYLKVNQGTGFIDSTFPGMVRSARAHGMATGGYDFVSCYCAAEAHLFVNLLRQAGMTRSSALWLPPVLDVEYGSATRSGVQTMLAIIRQAFGRAGVYTGAWYWVPHLGCFWPGVTGWLAGYPNASPVCGMQLRFYVAHQYTDKGFNGATTSDMTAWRGTVAGFHAFARIHVKPKPKPHPKPRPRPHKHVTSSDRHECRALIYDRDHHYRRAAHRRWRALRDRGVLCTRHGAYLRHH